MHCAYPAFLPSFKRAHNQYFILVCSSIYSSIPHYLHLYPVPNPTVIYARSFLTSTKLLDLSSIPSQSATLSPELLPRLSTWLNVIYVPHCISDRLSADLQIVSQSTYGPSCYEWSTWSSIVSVHQATLFLIYLFEHSIHCGSTNSRQHLEWWFRFRLHPSTLFGVNMIPSSFLL